MPAYLTLEKMLSGYSGLLVGSSAWAITKARELSLVLDSAATLAGKRLELGPYAQVSWTGSRVTDSLVWAEDQYHLATSPALSPLLRRQSQEFHRQGLEIPYVRPLNDLIPLGTESFDVPWDALAHHPATLALLGDVAQPYGAWLHEQGIPVLPFSLPPASLATHYPTAFIRPLVVRCTDNWSGLVGTFELHQAYGTRAWVESVPAGAEGALVEEERFSEEALRPLASLLSLEPRAYGLGELQTHCRGAGSMPLLGVALRVLRGGNTIPVDHSTFTPEATHG